VELTAKKYTGNDWRKLLSTRRGTILVATVCALLAAGILLFAMSRYRHSVDTSGNQQTVFLATELIQKGTSGDAIASQQLFKATSVAAKQATAGTIADTAQLQGKVAIADIYPGQQLTAADFTTDGGLASRLAPNQRAVTVTVDQAHGMIGQLKTGEHVDVYAGFNLDPGNGRPVPVVRLIMTNVQVLAAGSSGGSSLGSSQNPSNAFSNVTLNVNDAQAGAVAYAADNGKVWLVLRPANATSTAPPSTIDAQSLLLGSRPINAGSAK
jgi:Flp pilus assembly protein CpaB